MNRSKTILLICLSLFFIDLKAKECFLISSANIKQHVLKPHPSPLLKEGEGESYCFILADEITDTIRLKEVVKPKKTYPQQPTLIKTNPFSILWGPIPFTSEYKLLVEIPSSRTQSIQVGFSYFRKSPLIAIYEAQTNGQYDPKLIISGFRLQIANKFYFVRKKYGAPFGFFVAPHISYSNAHISIGKSRAYRYAYYNITHFNINLLAGVQVGRGKKISAEIFTGIGYKKNTWDYRSGNKVSPIDITELGEFYNSNLKLTLGFTLGYAIY